MALSHLPHLQAVEAVLRLGTFRAAADELGVTPAAVGQRIRTLEDRIGRPLFHREADGVKPTAAALAAAPGLAAGFARLTAAHSALAAALPANRVALSATEAFAEAWLPLQLPGFFARAREVDLRLETTRALADLHGPDFDFAVRFALEPGAGLDGIPLFRGCLLPLCNAEFADRHRLVPERDDLEGVPLIHLDDPTTDPDWLDWPGWCRRTGFRLPGRPAVQAFSKLSSGLRIARAGLGLVLGGLVEAAPALRNGTLVTPFGVHRAFPTRYHYWLVWNSGRRLSPVQRRFRDWLAARAADERRRLATEFPGL